MMTGFKMVRSEAAIKQTLKALHAGIASLLREKRTDGDRLFVLNERGETVGILGNTATVFFRDFMMEHEQGDGLFPGPQFAQTYRAPRTEEPINAMRRAKTAALLRDAR